MEAGLEPAGGQESRTRDWELSNWVDSKPVQGAEEEHDRSLRKRGLITGRERMEGVEGPDSRGGYTFAKLVETIILEQILLS